MSSIRSLVSFSALLGVVSFVAVMVFAPAGERGRGLNIYGEHLGLPDQAARMRAAMANGRELAAQNIAARTVEVFPDEPEAWLWKVLVEWSSGRPAVAADDARRLETLVLARPVPPDAGSQSARAYRLGWANWVLSREEAARAFFLDAASLYEQGTSEFVSGGILHYNLACYLAMAGETERAADHFVRAVDAGYGNDNGWWQVDPDLDPIRQFPAYLDAAAVLENRARERALRREARLAREASENGGDNPFDGAWQAPVDAPTDPESWRNGRTVSDPSGGAPEPDDDPEETPSDPPADPLPPPF